MAFPRFRMRLAGQLAAYCVCALTAGPALANSVDGAWLSPSNDNWPLVPVHAILTPDGRVLTYGSNAAGNATGFFHYDIWDPAEGLSGGHLTLQNNTLTDIFCSYAVILPDSGDILIAGGDLWDGTTNLNKGNNKSTIFRPADGTLASGNDMKLPRWYATVTPLMNGEMYIQGGKGGAAYAEVRGLNGQFRKLTGMSTSPYHWWYPRNFLAPDGRVFGYDFNGKMYFVNPAGNGSLTPAGQMATANVGKPSTAAMFQPGRILEISGKNNKAFVIDINGAQPVVTETDSLSTARVWGNATVLPDGQVLVTGGGGSTGAKKVEIWNPNTEQWTVGAAGSKPRRYHSIALLLPDASVLVGGGGASPGQVNYFVSEIYYPPYLYNTTGGFASRPVIESAPDTLSPGVDFSIEVSGSGTIDRVTLVQTGAATHAVNSQQRFVELPFTTGSGTVSVQMHDQATDVPPGYYLLFVIKSNGVPSVGKIVRINVP